MLGCGLLQGRLVISGCVLVSDRVGDDLDAQNLGLAKNPRMICILKRNRTDESSRRLSKTQFETWAIVLAVGLMAAASWNPAAAQQPATQQPAAEQSAAEQSAIGRLASPGNSSGIAWLTSATQAAEVAGRTGKPILLYVRSASCHYCDLMQSDVWENPEAAAWVQRGFVPLKLSREQNAEAVRSLGIRGFPATLIFSPDRQFVHRIDGYVKVGEFLNQIADLPTSRTASAGAVQRR